MGTINFGADEVKRVVGSQRGVSPDVLLGVKTVEAKSNNTRPNGGAR
jgi:hypothetical protein